MLHGMLIDTMLQHLFEEVMCDVNTETFTKYYLNILYTWNSAVQSYPPYLWDVVEG